MTKKVLLVLVLVVLVLGFIPNDVVAQVRFAAFPDWNGQDEDDESVTMVLTTYEDSEPPVLLDIEEMEFEAGALGVSTWSVEFVANASAVTWAVEIWPKTYFDTDLIVDLDDINHGGNNFLNPHFIFGE